MTTYKFQDYRLKPVQAIQYDGTLAMAAWLEEQDEEFTVTYSTGADEGNGLFLRGQEIKKGEYVYRDEYRFGVDRDFEKQFEPVHAPKTLSDLLGGGTVYHLNEPVTGM